jgi:hypothetical protein
MLPKFKAVTEAPPPEHPDVEAWNRARVRNQLELASLIAAGLFITAMFVVFCRILTS